MSSRLRDSLTSRLEVSLTKADSEQLARSIVEEQYSVLEKEKIMKELEIEDMMERHKQELGEKEATISSVRLEWRVFLFLYIHLWLSLKTIKSVFKNVAVNVSVALGREVCCLAVRLI